MKDRNQILRHNLIHDLSHDLSRNQSEDHGYHHRSITFSHRSLKTPSACLAWTLLMTVKLRRSEQQTVEKNLRCVSPALRSKNRVVQHLGTCLRHPPKAATLLTYL